MTMFNLDEVSYHRIGWSAGETLVICDGLLRAHGRTLLWSGADMNEPRAHARLIPDADR